MKRNKLKPLFLVGSLIIVTCAAIVYANKENHPELIPPPVVEMKNGVVTLSGHLTQGKILYGGDGTAALSLTMTADDVLDLDKGDDRHVDMVVVLDRSGSMGGDKIVNARYAVLDLLSRLSAKDRFALITYSDGVRRDSNLVKVTSENRQQLQVKIRKIATGGSTNLGAGLREGINVLLAAQNNGNSASKIILISDGLANRGITSLASLGTMASVAVEKEFAISTVGVGIDFNEQLMTYVADRGTGNYYFLENPQSFARVFQKEFQDTRRTVATSIEIRVPLADGMSVTSASGYPIEIKENQAIFYPGDLLSGQIRKVFLTLRLPTDKEGTIEIGGINARYRYNGNPYTVALSEPFRIACVKDKKEVFSAIDKGEWEEKVLKDDFNRLREEVALDIKKGKEKEALNRIQKYHGEQQAINAGVGSSAVKGNLERDLDDLRGFVKDTFEGNSGEVAHKQKMRSKALQYNGYKGRRSNR
ncbi:MAG: VWA domain-containing protein [Desulfatiglandales bacterium]